MRVWVIYTDAGMGRLGVFGVGTDDEWPRVVTEASDFLRDAYGVTGKFSRLDSPEPYYRDDERVFRCSWLTVVARPFQVEVPDA